jgi:hypothetical protein
MKSAIIIGIMIHDGGRKNISIRQMLAKATRVVAGP